VCHGWQAQTTEAGFGNATVQGFSGTQPPGALRAKNGRKGRPLGNPEAAEFMIALATCLPLDPDDATQAPLEPTIEGLQLAPLAEAEVAASAR
jgi:hypothetical protein